MSERNHDARQALIAELTERFRPICRDLSEAEFAKIIGAMADTRLRDGKRDLPLAQRVRGDQSA
jgi:hypothetical protein